ncbi:AbrB/MazE/SpoVT family DNA-binding domain-containing protein [Nitrososphaera sp.]|uniref:AbrB/MazE/SpoVT family DNA-binding domain-containing protein n=1 Tax=Nitrososphaera sp. TaxID=1971748 RepID=UPI00181DE198|nr:AbrB/MazE/SpoVT family DNA-binding domain-containing protein [Nitrososphaera sp.]NWG36568.1 AbrB/MazE/SpoVT family DNA-binding domain-containing protein [Nitrososphaera sp.]
MATQDEMEITIVSDKGQIVIPAALRNRFGLKPRSKLLVYGLDDAIVLKKLVLPDPKEEMEKLWKKIDKKIEKYGELSDEDIQKEIQKVRSRRRKSKQS